MDTDFSIIIPAHNAEKTLGWCLEGVAGQDYAGTFEVLVVESGDGGYLEDMAERYPSVRFIHAPFRLFSGQARNVAVRHASGKTLVFLDADCRPEHGWLASLGESHECGYSVVCGALENGTPDCLVGTAEYLVSKSFYSPATPSRELVDSTASSANMSVSSKIFNSAGGFPGTERANDFLFSRRLHALGAVTLFSPSAAVKHMNPDNLADFTRGQVKRGHWNARARIELGTRGSITRRFPPLAFVLFFLRLYRMVIRCARYRVVPPTTLIKELPLCLVGMAAWTWGYFKASLDKDSQLLEGERLPLGWEQFEIIQSTG